MHEVAETRPGAFAHLVLATTGLSEVGDWRQFSIDRSSSEPAIVQVLCAPISIFLPPEFDVHIAHQMVTQIVAHIHFLDLAVFVLALDEHVLEEVVVVLLHFLVGHVSDH